MERLTRPVSPEDVHAADEPPCVEPECHCKSGRGTTPERDEHDRCIGCLYSAGHALDCPLYPQPEPGRGASCVEWAATPLEPQEVCPSCGHYALWHDERGCGKCVTAPARVVTT